MPPMIMEEFFRLIACGDDNRYAVIIEDDGKVAYAYLMEEEMIIGDVWLYNNRESPLTAPWNEGKKMPFANPVTYLNLDKQISPLGEEDDVHVKWNLVNNDLKEVLINIRGQLVAKLRPGSKPGWSSVVVADRPLAKSSSFEFVILERIQHIVKYKISTQRMSKKHDTLLINVVFVHEESLRVLTHIRFEE